MPEEKVWRLPNVVPGPTPYGEVGECSTLTLIQALRPYDLPRFPEVRKHLAELKRSLSLEGEFDRRN